jgi:hypothetical protein
LARSTADSTSVIRRSGIDHVAGIDRQISSFWDARMPIDAPAVAKDLLANLRSVKS